MGKKVKKILNPKHTLKNLQDPAAASLKVLTGADSTAEAMLDPARIYKRQKVKKPKAEPIKPAPLSDDAQRQRAAKRKAAGRRGGRASTVLSEDSKLG